MISRILIVQEYPRNINDLEVSLLGYELLVTRTFLEAVDALVSQTFDMIICAVHLQSGSVFDLLRMAKHDPRHRNTPFVFFCNQSSEIASYVSDTIEMTAKLLGADKYITTFEFDAAAFRQEVESLLPKETPKVDERRHLFFHERANAYRASIAGDLAGAEQILRKLLEEMYARTDLYQSLDFASVQFELSEILEKAGKVDEAEKSRALIPDF